MIIEFIEQVSPERQDCGYCGWEKASGMPHNCDGFGHSAGYGQNGELLIESGTCPDCRRGVCEKREWLRQNVEEKTGKQVVNVEPLGAIDFNSGLRATSRRMPMEGSVRSSRPPCTR